MLYNLVLGKTGACSGKFLTAGSSYTFRAQFDVTGHAGVSVGPLQASLALDTETRQITGTVSESGVTANLVANLSSNVLPPARYTLLFSPAPSTNVVPPGDGYALVSLHDGAITLSGALADGTPCNQTVPVSQTGDIPVYADLYTKAPAAGRGLLLGWINLTNLQAAAPSNCLTWIKQPQTYRSPALYTNGFTNTLLTQGALWTEPETGASAVSLTNAQLLISNADLFLDFTNVFVSGNKLADSAAFPTNSLAGSINPKTGLVTIVFGNGDLRDTNTGVGAMLQDTTNAGGFFLTRSNAGSVHLQP
jgi:hypothetical protein